MKRTSRRVVTGLLVAAAFSAVGLVGCSGSGDQDGESATLGEISLPLIAQGASGTTYRLRNATFVILSEHYNYNYELAGAAGSSTAPGKFIVSSETDPNASNISLSLEQAYYSIQLLPGWQMEKMGTSGPQTVEATLLSEPYQWAWVTARSTSVVKYRFGVGDREFWLNGKLNIGIEVLEAAGAGGADSGPGQPEGGARGFAE